MMNKDDIYSILKTGSSPERLVLYDRLPDVPSKLHFRHFVSEDPCSDKFHIAFGDLCSKYCEGQNAATGKELSHALYRHSLDHHRSTGKHSTRAINYALYHARALHQLGEHEEVTRFVDESITAIDTIFPGWNQPSWYNPPLRPTLNMPDTPPLFRESKAKLPEEMDSEEVDRLKINILKGESLVARGRIDEAKEILNDKEIQENTDRLLVIMRKSLSYSISKYITPGIGFTFTPSQHDRTEERREEALQDSVDILKDCTKHLFPPEQSDEISKGLDNALKNNPRADFSDPVQREEYSNLRNMLERRKEGKYDESDKAYMDDLVNKYTGSKEEKPERVKCNKCNGSGRTDCPRCNGLGSIFHSYSSSDLSGYIAAGIRPITSEPCPACSGTRGTKCFYCKGTGFA